MNRPPINYTMHYEKGIIDALPGDKHFIFSSGEINRYIKIGKYVNGGILLYFAEVEILEEHNRSPKTYLVFYYDYKPTFHDVIGSLEMVSSGVDLPGYITKRISGTINKLRVYFEALSVKNNLPVTTH